MALIIKSLIEDPLIRTRLVAGGAGLERRVLWAHTCEVADPWNWLGPGELLMTDGYSLPADADGQVAFLRQLAAADLAGLALGEGFVAAPLTPEAITAADDLGFPVLLTARNVPFVTIARAVAEAQQTGANSRASQVLRLYDLLRRTHGRSSEDELLHLVGRELRATLHVLELTAGRELLPSHEDLPQPLRAAALEVVRQQGGRLAAFNRLKAAGTTALMTPVGSEDAAALLARPHTPGELPDILLVQHAAMIAELEVAQRAARAARARARGSELVRQMMTGSIDPDAAAAQLRANHLGDGPWTVTAWSAQQEPSPEGASGEALADALTWVPWPHLFAQVGDIQVLVVEHAQFTRGLGLDHLTAITGASQPLSVPARFGDALREARWALDSAQTSGLRSAVYDAHGSYFMPKTLAEGEVVVRRVLGPVLDYDQAHGAQLMLSLSTFFRANRSWVAGARELGIHKQTLVYRIRKVEDLTGMDLRDFGVQAELYFALRTWRLLALDLEPPQAPE